MSQSINNFSTRGIRRRLLLASTAGLGVSVLSPAATPATVQEPLTLRYSDHEPLGGMRTRFLNDVVFRAIENESNGRLKIEAHWNGEIAAAYDVLGALRSGSIDMGTVVPEYTAKELPLHQIFKSFPTGPSASAQVSFFRHVYAQVPALTQELDKSNVVPLFFGTGYPVAFFSTASIASLDGLKGGKWRSASFWHQEFLRNAGALAVNIPWGPEIVQSLKATTLDGLMVNIDSGYMLKVHETASNVLTSKSLWLGHLYLLTMNREVWASLAQGDKDAISRATDHSHRTLGVVMERSFETQLDDLRNAGASVRTLTTGELQRWVRVTRYRNLQNAWTQDQKSRGVEDVGAVVAKVRSTMSDLMR